MSIRRNQVASMDDPNHNGAGSGGQEDLALFQKNLTDRLLSLHGEDDSGGGGETLLTLPWLRKLLDAFLSSVEEFKEAVSPSIHHDRAISEFLDRAVKALDVCNAVSDAVDSVRLLHRQAEIAVSALDRTVLLEGQFVRARRAMSRLLLSMAPDDKDGSRGAERNWSFGRSRVAATSSQERRSGGHYLRSVSSGVGRTWSAGKHVQAMSANLYAPRGGIAAVDAAAYAMSSFMVFVVWALVAAFFPSQDRGPVSLACPPRHLSWSGPLIGLQEKITDEWRKREKKGSSAGQASSLGLLVEVQRLEKCARGLVSSDRDRTDEIGAFVDELSEACGGLDEGLLPLQGQVREVFHRIVWCRKELLDCLNQVHRSAAASSSLASATTAHSPGL
ncbi:hypothetical protein QJS04_geneDACA011559 [Acorus gramineus]|uniref:Uncharacterized protein n=1 Tax=Acorus gramineus TaxID=55184 RepID=A0AAV8ZZ21_ACOGR|nr:hypothetical protein QJS04_geneDACA024208 [Acorus gramineus]KAK1261615.1 hypothetical protein QJS04_geneDACA011559 [Acorus gramineus]